MKICMNKLIRTALLFGLTLAGMASADLGLPNLDRTDKVHDRRYLDSMNVYNRRPIRVNQSGFRPQDYKYAYVADTQEKKFSVIDAKTGAEAWSGSLTEIIRQAPIYQLSPDGKDSSIVGYKVAPITKPGIYINGAFNSTSSVYQFYSGVESAKNIETLPSEKERLYRADFTGLSPTTPGEYFVVVGKDTSATFHIHPSIFNSILENSLKFFGIQRCGNTKSHFHAACHLKDGSKVGHNLTGGWHDCGDHFKVSETLGYTAYVLSMVYLTYQDKAEDRYGESYADTVFTDGIPDILHEAKIGTDFLLKLYRASKADGLIAKGDMYHSVGVDQVDHDYWDLPERQDAQPPSEGGPDRVVLTGIGSNTAGMFIAAMANVAVGYRVYDPLYADSLLEAARDMYANVLMPSFENYKSDGLPGKYTDFPGFYTGGGPKYDDGAAAALAMWYATKDTTYRYDLFKNPNIFNNENYRYNLDYFRAGFLGNPSGFTQGGWATDYQNIHSYVLFAFQKLILNSEATATEYGLTPLERDTLSMRTMATFRKVLDNSTNDGDSLVLENPATQGDPHEGSSKLHVITPYNLVWTSFDWGVMRYNMGTANAIFLMYELTGDERYLKVALDNMYFILGANPWDISFLMGAGDKNPQHPHNRASNPDGYNAGGMPYEYRCPIGALMGGREPNKTLIEDWNLYTSTETCIDFTAQFLFPAQSLAQTLPIDAEGPLFNNIAGTPISETQAIISWDANEVALVTVFYGTSPDITAAKSVQQTKATKGGAITLDGLVMGQTYYFFLEGMDTKRNMTTDDNHGQWYQFTMTNTTTNISGVTICQVDNRSAKIYWWSSDRMNGVVNYGTSMSALNEVQNAEGGAVLFHEAKLTNLQPGTTYYFSVSSGTTTDNNGGNGYKFTTDEYATTVEMDIYIKPLNKNGCTTSSDWKNCNTFLVIVTNRDTMAYQDLDLRLYVPEAVTGASDNKSIWDGTGHSLGSPTITFGSAVPYLATSITGTKEEGFYLPIHIEGELFVSGSYFFEMRLDPGYGSLEGAWSFRAHTAANEPEQYQGIDLTKGPKYVEESNSTMYIETINGVKEKAFTKVPYITAHYHGKYIYGYGPDYTPEQGPQVNRTVTLNFTSPFVSPYYSIEKVDYATTYTGSSTVSPTGFLNDLEMNGAPQNFIYEAPPRTDSYVFSIDTILGYGNNYMEWVSWHNHYANKNAQNPYDCACAIYRTNVEIDSITTPAELRFLVFDKKQYVTYKGENGAHKAEVHVQLLDSTFNLMDTVSITLELTTDNNTVQFYASYDASISITSITLEKGQATFYVASSIADTTTMYARSNGGTKVSYQPASAELLIQDLPPWPIIEVAKMVDTDCDNKPDALNITLSKAYDDSASFVGVNYTYGSDTLTTKNIIRQEGKEMVVSIDIRDTSINTNPTGYIALQSNYKGVLKNEEAQYLDGIAPTLLSISVLERLDTATSDKVYLMFSEPISAPGEEWPVQLFAADGASKQAVPAIKFSRLYNDSLNVWEFELAFNADGSSAVTEGMFAQLLSSSTITDKSGNKVSDVCGQPLLPVTLKLLPVPMNYAAITDNDEDGQADRVYIEFKRAMDQKHIPAKISAIFGNATAPETLWVAGTSLVLAADNMSGIIDFPIPFSLGKTSGPYDGMTIGMSGAGKVIQHLGSGASYEYNEVLAQDKVGPVFTSAYITSTEKYDVLRIDISEPTIVRDASLIFYRQKIDEVDTAVFESTVRSIDLSETYISAVYLRDAGHLSINDGNMLRLQPREMSAIVDKNGNNAPSLNNPWIPISAKGNPEIKFNLHLQNQVAKTHSSEDLSLPIAGVNGIRLYIQDPSSKKLDLVISGKVVMSGIAPEALHGAVWEVDMTVPRGTSSSEPAAWDSLMFKYNIPIYSNLGSYVNRIAGNYSISSSKYLSPAGKIMLYIEWPNLPGTGIQSEQGRSVGTGAFIYKAQFDYTFVPNKTKDQTTIQKFSYKSSYDKTEKFGIKRIK